MRSSLYILLHPFTLCFYAIGFENHRVTLLLRKSTIRVNKLPI